MILLLHGYNHEGKNIIQSASSISSTRENNIPQLTFNAV